jgi:hypothetical protein
MMAYVNELSYLETYPLELSELPKCRDRSTDGLLRVLTPVKRNDKNDIKRNIKRSELLLFMFLNILLHRSVTFFILSIY